MLPGQQGHYDILSHVALIVLPDVGSFSQEIVVGIDTIDRGLILPVAHEIKRDLNDLCLSYLIGIIFRTAHLVLTLTLPVVCYFSVGFQKS